MIFDKETEALIDLNVIYGAGKHITDKCMIIFSKEIHTYLVSHYKCEIIGEIGACNGNISIYCLDYKGKKFFFEQKGFVVASPLCFKKEYVKKKKYIKKKRKKKLYSNLFLKKYVITTKSINKEKKNNNKEIDEDFMFKLWVMEEKICRSNFNPKIIRKGDIIPLI